MPWRVLCFALGQTDWFANRNKRIGKEQPTDEGNARVADQIIPVKKTGPTIPQQKAAGPSPKAKKDAERQEGIEGDETSNMERRIQNVQDIGKSSESEVKGGIRQDSHVAPDIRCGRHKEEEMKEQIGTEDNPEQRVLIRGVSLHALLHGFGPSTVSCQVSFLSAVLVSKWMVTFLKGVSRSNECPMVPGSMKAKVKIGFQIDSGRIAP